MKNCTFKIKNGLFLKFLTWIVLFSFFSSLITPPNTLAQIPGGTGANSFLLPNPGIMIAPTASYVAPMLKGMKVTIQDPFAFDFILDSGNANLTQQELKEEANKLIKYFLVSLAIPENDLWVNLSPYEKDRIIPAEFGATEMGRDLLAQDYILKQLTASLIYPEENLGREFWDKVYARAQQLYGTNEIPVNTFNKVWIIPDKAVVYEQKDIAYVLESHLKVMLEEDYVALKQNLTDKKIETDQLKDQEVKEISSISSEIIKEIVIPEIEKEVNNGQNFAKLRQVYHSLILAKWYKERLKTSILNQAYSDQKKINGVNLSDKNVKERIYQQYLEAFKKGVFDYIKEDYDAQTQQVVQRKYFSGGLALKVQLEIKTDPARLAEVDTIGKLSWIKGIYRQPRSSPGSVNDFIRKQFQEGLVTVGEPITLDDGSQRKTYYVEDLLKAMGQLGHIGFIEKDENGQAVEGGQEVVFLDSKYGTQEVVRKHEGFKVSKWVQKRKSLGLLPGQMREWLKSHLSESTEFLQEVDRDADQQHSIESIYAQAEKAGELPSNDQIAQTYIQSDDFKDLNLAAGRWGVRDATTQGIMPGRAVYTVEPNESYDDIVVKELAKQRGVSVDDIEADFQRTITMLEERIEYNGFVDPDKDETSQKIHEIFDRLIAVYKTKTNEAPGRFHVVDANTVNAFVIRKRTDVYFYKGLYEALYDISKRMSVPLTEDIIAFIIAHELSHSLQHTSHEGLDIRDLNEKASPYLVQMIKNAEYDADMRALELMDKSGYSVFGAIDAMTFLEFINNSSQAESVLSSHPYTSLRKHRLSQVIFDQKTTVFTNVKSHRILLIGSGRMNSQDVDFRYLMDRSEQDLLSLAQDADSLQALDQLTGMLVLKRRMNALRSLVNEKQLKTSFLQHVYIQAVLAAVVTRLGTHVMPDNINYSDMRAAAAIYDFGNEIATGGILAKSKDKFEKKAEEIIQEINQSLANYSSSDVVAARKRLLDLFSMVRGRASGLNHTDFDGFLLPFEEVKDLIPIFTEGKGVKLKGVTVGQEKKKTVDQKLVDNAIKDPRKLISAFFYANYLGQEPSVEFGIPTTDMRVKLQRRKNTLYHENPAYRSVQSADDRKNVQNVILLHYAMYKTGTNVFKGHLNYDFPGIDKFLEVTPETAQQLFMKYFSLMSSKYPKPVAIVLAAERIDDYFDIDFDKYSGFLSISVENDTSEGFIEAISQIRRAAKQEYKGELAGLEDYSNQRVSQFIDNHPLVAFIREALRQYGDRMPKEMGQMLDEELDGLRSREYWFSAGRNISKILATIAHIYSQEPQRVPHVSEVFSAETTLDYYVKERKIDSFKLLLVLPDWAVSDYLNKETYNTKQLIEKALKEGASIDDIFTFMKTRLSYVDRRKIFEEFFLGYDEKSKYLLDSFKTTFNNEPKEIIVWFLGMFSKRDALELMDSLSRKVLYEKIKKDGVKELSHLTIALLEYIYSQTSRNFHANKETVRIYLDLIRNRIDESGKANDENYAQEAVYNALMILSAAVDLKIEASRSKGFSNEGTPDFKSENTSIFPPEFGGDRSHVTYKSNFALHNFSWNDSESTNQSIFVTRLTELSVDQLRNLLRQRLRYVESQVDVEYRGEVFSLKGLDNFFANIITFIILKKLHNPKWQNTTKTLARLDDLLEIEIGFSRENGEINLYSRKVTLKKNQDEINTIPFKAINDNCVGVCIPSGAFDPVWNAYVEHNNLQGRFPEIIPLLQNPNVGNEVINNPIGFLLKHKSGERVPYRKIIKKFFSDSSVYSKLFNEYVKLEGKGYVHGKYKSLDERLKWLEKVLPNRSIIKDGILGLWESDIFPEIIADLPTLVELARKASNEEEDLQDMWTLLGEMDDDVGRLQRLNDEINLSPAKIHELLDFYTIVIPLALSPQKIARYGATAYTLWTKLPDNLNLGLSEHLEALTKFMPEPSLLRDELLIRISNKYLKHLEEVSSISEKLYSNNLISRNRDLRTEDFMVDTLLHLFGAATNEDRRDILLWISGARDKPQFVSKVENEYNIDFTTLPDDVKLLPPTIRDKFIEGFMLGDNGVLDPQSNADREVMSDFLSKLFVNLFLEETKITDTDLQNILLKVFLTIMVAYPPYRRVQVIKALAALRARPDFEKTSIGDRLAVLLGVLGPVGMKVAQYLSENETLIPDAKIRSSLGALRHKAPEIPKISAVAVLENEIPSAEIMVQEIGGRVGVASIKQVNRGKWLDVEKLAEMIATKANSSDAQEVRNKMQVFKSEEIGMSEIISFLLEKAGQYDLNLKEAGVRVVYKIRRPNIESTIGIDFDALGAAAGELKDAHYKGESLNVGELVETVKEWVELEMYFSTEAKFHDILTNLDYTWAEGLAAEAGMTIGHSKIFYVTDALIVEEEIPGILVVSLAPEPGRVTIEDVMDAGYERSEAGAVLRRLTSLDRRQAHVMLSLEKAGFPEQNLDRLAQQLLSYDYMKLIGLLREMLLHQIFVDGIFHADLHQANVMLTPEGKVVMIDRGNVGRLNLEQMEGAKTLLKGLSLRETSLIKQGIDRIFLNAQYPDGVQPTGSEITEKEIIEVLDKGQDLRMTMSMISVRAIRNAKRSQGGKDFSTFLKALTQAMWIFPTDIINGLDTLQSISRYIGMNAEETERAAQEQAKYFVFKGIDDDESEHTEPEDITKILERNFYKKTNGYFLHAWWQSIVLRFMKAPLERLNSQATGSINNLIPLVRTRGRQILEQNIDEFAERQDDEISVVFKEMASVELAEQFVMSYEKERMKERPFRKFLVPIAMPLLKGGLILARPFTQIYLETGLEWFDATGKQYVEKIAPGMTLREGVTLISKVFKEDFKEIKQKLDEKRVQKVRINPNPDLSAREEKRDGGEKVSVGEDQSDQAVLASKDNVSMEVQKNPGGIDFNPNLLELQIQGNGLDFNVPVNNGNIEQIHIEGLLPVIINITPITNLPLILGSANPEERQLTKVQ